MSTRIPKTATSFRMSRAALASLKVTAIRMRMSQAQCMEQAVVHYANLVKRTLDQNQEVPWQRLEE